jgi:hypothetical protein
VSDTPKAFSRILYKKESMEQRRGFSSEDFGLPKGKGKKGTADGSAPTENKNPNAKKVSAMDELRIQPGEKMGEFSRRVDDHMRDKLLKATKDNTAGGSKKKK